MLGRNGIRRLKWEPLERLAGTVGLSVILVYLIGLGIHISGLPMWTCHGITLLSAGLLAIYRRDVVSLLRHRRTRNLLLMFAALLSWILLLLLVIRHNTGGSWCCDWFEHYQRSLHFLDRGPKNQMFLNLYLLPARPPLMNVYAMYGIAIAGRDFSVYQVVSAFLDCLLLLPLALVARLFSSRGAPFSLLAALLALNPQFFENSTFAWTKIPTAFFVALAFYLYLVGLRRASSSHVVGAFVSISAAMLVHYSAGPYLVLMGLHYAVMVPRRRLWRQALVAALLSGMLLATWFGYSVARFGVKTTLESNSTVTDSRRLSPRDNLLNVRDNVINTIVPYFMCDDFKPKGELRDVVIDVAFHAYRNNIIISMGSVGGILALLLSIRSLARRRPRVPLSERLFWILGVPLTFLLGVASHGMRNPFGLAHICGQSLTYLGVAFLASQAPKLPRVLKVLLVHGVIFDFIFGIAIELYLEGSTAEWTRSWNWLYKQDNHLEYLGDVVIGGVALWEAAIFAVTIAWIWAVLRSLGLLSSSPEKPSPTIESKAANTSSS